VKIRLGISAWLLGERVRYDGGHRHGRFIIDTLGQYCGFVAVCPEVECGLGTPRDLQHMMGYFKKELSAGEKEDLLGTIEQYLMKYVPLVVPLTLIRH